MDDAKLQDHLKVSAKSASIDGSGDGKVRTLMSTYAPANNHNHNHIHLPHTLAEHELDDQKSQSGEEDLPQQGKLLPNPRRPASAVVFSSES